MRREAVILFLAAAVLGATITLWPQSRPASKKPTGAEQELSPAVSAAVRSISGERMRAHVRFLASDLLEGRGTGQRGGDIVGEYIATQFALMGLEPAGENGTYLQKVPLVGIKTQPETTFSIHPATGAAMDLTMLDDYVVMDETQNTESMVDADMVFVGYGIEAPEYGWNDYQGMDVRGKVLLMLVNEPPSDDAKFFTGKALTYYGRWTYKFEQAARKGAVGAVLVHKTEMASYGWNVVRSSWSGERSRLRADGTPLLKAASWVQLEVARKALAASGQDLDALIEQAGSRNFRPVPLSLRLKARVVSKIRPFESSNVIGIVRGSDASMRREAVLYTAHYDHLGVRPEQAGDSIYNGAEDNATGCAVLLELARAFGAAGEKPRRSILFAAVTAEEQGLLGSEYLGLHPPIPTARITLNLNYDGIAPRGQPEQLEVAGAERTSLFPVVQNTAREFGLEIVPDSNPTAGYFYRSDHFSLARVGVPAFSVNEGLKFKDHTLEWGKAMRDEYTAKRYHQPSDEYRSEMDFSSGQTLARFGLALGWKAATLRQSTAWRPGDEFEAARKASLKAVEGSWE
ncbi:MAG: M28 family peptidase [Terriglobales bacterium]